MQIKNLPITELKQADYNPRKIGSTEMKKLKASIERYGFIDPVIVNQDNTIIGGHQRTEAARQLNLKEVPCVVLDLDKDSEKELNIALNKIGGKFDDGSLTDLLAELKEKGRLAYTGFKDKEVNKLLDKQNLQDKSKLLTKRTVAPFSILDTNQTYWKNRKKEWFNYIDVKSDTDPVLLEVLASWYAKDGATIHNPYTHDYVHEEVCSTLGYEYVTEPDEGVDIVFCEVNNETPLDVLAQSYQHLDLNGHAIIEVRNHRDSDGVLQHLASHVVEMMTTAGYKLHEEIVVVHPYGFFSQTHPETLEQKHHRVLLFAKNKEVAITNKVRALVESQTTATAHHDVLVFKK